MARKKIIKEKVYRTYFLHQKDEGLVQDYLDKLIDITEKSFTKGDWEVCHLRYQLSDGVSNSEFFEELSRIFPPGKSGNSTQDALRYVWVRELGETKQPSDHGITGGIELAEYAHYHAAIFINRGVRSKFLPNYLHKLVNPSFKIPNSESKTNVGRKRTKPYLQYFYLPYVNTQLTSPELWDYVDAKELRVKESIDKFRLTLNCVDSIYYAIAWLCYLSKVETKFKVEGNQLSPWFKSGRNFGTSQISPDWRKDEKHWTVKKKINELSEAKFLKAKHALANSLDDDRERPSFSNKTKKKLTANDKKCLVNDWTNDDTFTFFNDFHESIDAESLPF